MSSERSNWSKKEGEEVTVTGKAENAKAGALLVRGPGSAIRVDGLAEWDEETVGKQVSVDAVVRRRPGFPAAEDSDEAIQGTATGRDVWVLELKQYRVVQ